MIFKKNSSKNEDFKLILYELNEVPERLIKHYIEIKPKSSIAKCIREGLIIKTFTSDTGELHPWSTWPTVHRGVCNTKHNIRFLNQDLSFSSEYRPIWEILLNNKIDIGIFGSLHSYPPLKRKEVKFYLPDTFAPNHNAYPTELSEFQKFNLRLSGQNKAISTSIDFNSIFNFLKLIFNKIITKRSAVKSIIQILKEFINKKQKKRRSLMQAIIGFEIYYKYLIKHKPSFSTYFTNHVAGMMHRYWKDLFPEDFGLSKKNSNNFNSKSIIKAMDIADSHISKLLKFSQHYGYNLLILSSMGQAAIDRGKYHPELVLKDERKLISKLNLNIENYKFLPAMQPDICVDCNNHESLQLLRESIKELKDSNGNNLFIERYEPVGLRINLATERLTDIDKTTNLNHFEKTFFFKDIGFEIIKRDIGTAYHVPEGILIANGQNVDKDHLKNLRNINTCQVAPIILNSFGIDIPDYMKSD